MGISKLTRILIVGATSLSLGLIAGLTTGLILFLFVTAFSSVVCLESDLIDSRFVLLASSLAMSFTGFLAALWCHPIFCRWFLAR